MNEQSPIVEVENVFIDYLLKNNWLNVIHDVSFKILPQEIHGLVGESGSGKSTLALAVMNYLAANARVRTGKVWFDGDDILHKSQTQLRRIWGSQMNLVPQDPLAALNPAFTIGNQMAEVTRTHLGFSSSQAQEHATEMLRRVRMADPGDVMRRYPHQLSGGMLQRVLIAMALSTHPKLLVLDEPTTALDVTTQAVILDLFRELILSNDAAALYVSHDLGTVAQLCNQVSVLYGGEIMESASVRQVFAQPLHPYTAGLLASLPGHTEGTETRLPTIQGVAPSLSERPAACAFASRCPVAVDHCHREKPILETTPDGRQVRCWRWEEIAARELVTYVPTETRHASIIVPKGVPVLHAAHITQRFGNPSLLDRFMGKVHAPVRAVDDVTITVKDRSTLGLVGESGSGKTTLARCLVALNTADDGQIQLRGINISRDLRHRKPETLRELRMVFQNPNDTLNPYQPVGQAIGRTLHVLRQGHASAEETSLRIAELLVSVGLTPDYAARYPAELSGGEKQRVAIARAFAADPALVVADEPTSSLDVSVQAVILNLLKDMRAQKGASYLLISHDLDVVSYLADQIAVMYLGQIVEIGDTDAIYDIPSHPYTEALLSAIPAANPDSHDRAIRLEGDVPSARNIPSGCRFHTRCPRKIGTICEQKAPPWLDAGNGHAIRCHIPIDELIAIQSASVE